MSLVIFDLVDDALLLPQERMQVAHMQEPPSLGDRLTLGSSRLWEVVAVDEYRNATGFTHPIYLAHCHRGQVPPRPEWFSVRQLQTYPSSLRVYLVDGELEHWTINLDGSSPKTGVLLPLFNPREHSTTPRDVGVEQVSEYRPKENVTHPCYQSIWVGDCVRIASPALTHPTQLQPA